MQNYYQGLMRCKDFMPFLKDRLIEHGWNIIDQDMETACWFVIQKQAADGGIMTFGFKERDYPNYGNLVTCFSLAQTPDEIEGRFVSPYNIVLHRFLVPTSNTYAPQYYIDIHTLSGYYSDDRMNSTLNYFSTSVPDTEESVAHLYYIISFTTEGFYVKTRGNPVLAGSITNGTYFGTFDNLTNIPASNPSQGCWGHLTVPNSVAITRLPATGENNTGINFTSVESLLNYGYISDRAGFSDLFYENANAFPVVRPIVGNWTRVPLFSIPNDFMLVCGKKANFSDENIFLEGRENTYIYTSPSGEIYNPGFLIKAIDCVKNVSVIDNNVGYKIEWTTPTDTSIVKIAVYAKASGYPESHDDSAAILVYENTSPTLGAIESYIDTDPSRYGQTMHYAVVAFDADETPHASLIIQSSRAKISNSIIELASHPTPLNISYASAYNYSNNNKIHAYYNPVAVYSCNDNANDTIVLDSINELHGTATANTNTLTTPGVLGNALNLAGNRYITLPASALLRFPHSFTIQSWIKRPTTFSVESAIFATPDDTTELRYRYEAATPNTSYFLCVLEYGASSFPFPYNWTNTEMQFVTLQRRGRTLSMFLNADRLNVGTPITQNIWNQNVTTTTIGSRTTARYFNGTYNGLEFYPHPLSHLQIKYNYNNGLGRVLTTNDIVDGMALIVAPSSIGERATYTLDEPINLTNVNNINLDCYSKLLGNTFKVVFINANGTEFSANCFLTTGSAWQNLTLDISTVVNELKNAVTKIAIEIVDASDYNIISIKNLIKA